MARKGQFKKGGGRVGGGTRKHRTSKGGALVIAPVAMPVARRSPRKAPKAHHHKKRSHRRHGGGHGGVTLVKAAVAAGVLANVADAKDGILGDKVYNFVQKLPGAKTFGGAVTTGLYLGAIHKFTRFGGRYRPWLAAAGLVGVIGAGLKLGLQGTGFKWLGDSVMDVEA